MITKEEIDQALGNLGNCFPPIEAFMLYVKDHYPDVYKEAKGPETWDFVKAQIQQGLDILNASNN